MRLLVVAAAILALSAPAYVQAADASKSRAPCQAAAKPAKGAACAKVRRKAAPVDNGTSSFARCRDVVSHRFTRCGGPNAEPVPAN